MRKSNCKGCRNIELGIKSVRAVDHTCGLTNSEILKKMKEHQGKEPFQDRIAQHKKRG